MASPLPESWSFVVDEKLAPMSGSRHRSEYLRWLFFAVTTLAPSVLEVLIAKERDDEAALAAARDAFRGHARTLEQALEGGPHLAGAELSAADVKVAAVLAWAASAGLLEGHARLREYAARVVERAA